MLQMMGVREHLSLQSIYEHATLHQANKKISDSTQVLYMEYELLSSGRSPSLQTEQIKKWIYPCIY